MSRRPSPALVVSLLALVMASAGTGYAATQLPRNSVGTAQLQPDAVTLAKIAPSATRQLKGKRGKTGARGSVGPQGPGARSLSLACPASAPGSNPSKTLTFPKQPGIRFGISCLSPGAITSGRAAFTMTNNGDAPITLGFFGSTITSLHTAKITGPSTCDDNSGTATGASYIDLRCDVVGAGATVELSDTEGPGLVTFDASTMVQADVYPHALGPRYTVQIHIDVESQGTASSFIVVTPTA